MRRSQRLIYFGVSLACLAVLVYIGKVYNEGVSLNAAELVHKKNTRRGQTQIARQIVPNLLSVTASLKSLRPRTAYIIRRNQRIIYVGVSLVCLAVLVYIGKVYNGGVSLNAAELVQKKTQSAIRTHEYKIMYDSLSVTDSFDFEKMSSERIAYIYHSILDAIEVPCRRKVNLGRIYDGAYEICDDEEWRLRKPCLVYSFGINNEFSFDDTVGKLYGCEIHSFDPSIKVKSHKRSEFVYFHKIGIGKKRLKTNDGWELYDLESIRRMLGHQNRTIDILKIDTEEDEWEFLENVLSTNGLQNVKQLIGEYHILKAADTRQNYLRRLKLIVSLRKLGFRSYYVIKTKFTPIVSPGFFKNNGTVPCCYEVSMFNMNFAK